MKTLKTISVKKIVNEIKYRMNVIESLIARLDNINKKEYYSGKYEAYNEMVTYFLSREKNKLRITR